MKWNEEHNCFRDGEMHPTICEKDGCGCRHYHWRGGRTSACRCGHGSLGHKFRPNCDGTFAPEVEARLAAAAGTKA